MSFIDSWIVPEQATVSPGLYVLVAVVALLATAVSKGGFGGGVGAISVPLMLQVAPARLVIGMWLPILIACDIATIGHYPKEWKPSAVARLAPGMVLGIILTSIILRMSVAASSASQMEIHEAWLKLGIAGITGVFLFMRWRSTGDDHAKPWQPTWAVGVPTGLAGGVTTTLAHAAGPIIVMFLLPQKLDKRVFVGTTGRFFFLFNSIKVPFLIGAGIITLVTFKYGIWLIVLSPVGVWLGSWLNSRVSARWFVRCVVVFLVLVAGKLVYDGMSVLL
jgi:hypothetical protein